MAEKLDVYMSVREQMRTGDMLQWKSRSVVGSLIRWRTPPPDPAWPAVNHTSMVLFLADYEGPDHRRFTTEALEHGSVLNYLSRRLADYDGEVWWYPLDDAKGFDRLEVGGNALEMIGIPYDYKSIVAQIFCKVSANARELFCSEYYYLSLGMRGKAPAPSEMPGLGLWKSPVKIL